jgi:hypothetical protein
MRCGGHLNPGPMRPTRNEHKILARTPEGKRSFRKYISRFEDIVGMDFIEIWRGHGAWI